MQNVAKFFYIYWQLINITWIYQKSKLRDEYMEIRENTWEFPDNVSFEEVPVFLMKFDKTAHDQTITFDLRKTVNIHSSFIGFLIHAKRKVEVENGELRLILSKSIEKTFSMLNLSEYLI